MRITFVLPNPGNSGGVRAVAIYAGHLRRRGHEVFTVIRPDGQWPLKWKVKALLRGKRWPQPRTSAPSFLVDAGIQARVLESCRPVVDADVPDGDVVIATWWETAEWVAALSKTKGVKCLFIQGDDREWYPPTDTKTPPRVVATWRLPMHKICVARHLGELMRKAGNVDSVDVVLNSVDTTQFDAPPRGRQARPTVGMVYSNARNKGSDITLEAVKLAQSRIPDLHLSVFGLHDPDEGVRFPPQTTFVKTPPQDQIRAIYASCDAWLFGSRSEGFGLPILEAMACRTPVIGTPAGAAPELLANGAGVLIPPEDPEAMAQAIEKVMAMDEPSWRALSDAAYAVTRRYTWDDAANLLEAALLRAVSRAGRSTGSLAPAMGPSTP